MAKKTAAVTTKAEDRKRRRDEESASSSSYEEEEEDEATNSSASSSSESDSERLRKDATTKAAAARGWDDSDSDEDSSDEETENALFRPVATARNDEEEEEEADDDNEDDSGESSSCEDDEDDGDEDNDIEDEDDDGREVQSKAAKKAVPTKPESVASKKKASEPDALSKEIEDEVARKTEATVYIEGIPYKANESDIVTHFASCGSVKEVRMPRYQDSGKPRGYAHVVFDSASSILKALKLDGKYLFGRYLTVKRAERPRTLETAMQEQKSVKKAVKGCKTVFVKHLPYDVDEAAVKDALSSCGTIVSVRLPLWNHTKKLKGFGYVEFATEEEAVAAVKRSGMKIGDRMVIISLETAASAPKASFRTTDGRFWRKGDEAKSSLTAKLTEKAKKGPKPEHKAKKQKTK